MNYKESFKEFDFNRDFEAVVIDNKNFDKNYEVKLFVQELIMTTLQDQPRNIRKNLNPNNIINIKDLKIKRDINMGNYLVCKPLILNDINIKIRKPNILDRVILRFYNGNPKFPYYIDARLPRKEQEEFIDLNKNKRNLKGNYYRLLMYREENMIGKDVNVVGKALEGLGYKANKYDKVNYVFDKDMLNSLLQFQKDNNLKQDGDVGPITFSKLKERYNNQKYC